MRMGPRCETLGKYVLPVFRSLVAKELISAYDFTQVQTAKKLGTTQAAISQYINSKRAFKGIAQIDKLLPQIHAMAKKTAKQLANNELTPEQVSVDFCKLCTSFCGVESEEVGDNYAI